MATTPVPHDHVVFTDLDGVEGVLVDLNSKHYFQLNATASLIWRGLIRGLPAEEIAQEMTAEYDVTLERARDSVAAIIGEFAQHRLITPPQARTAP
jgi:hypothetical protein